MAQTDDSLGKAAEMEDTSLLRGNTQRNPNPETWKMKRRFSLSQREPSPASTSISDKICQAQNSVCSDCHSHSANLDKGSCLPNGF